MYRKTAFEFKEVPKLSSTKKSYLLKRPKFATDIKWFTVLVASFSPIIHTVPKENYGIFVFAVRTNFWLEKYFYVQWELFITKLRGLKLTFNSNYIATERSCQLEINGIVVDGI